MVIIISIDPTICLMLTQMTIQTPSSAHIPGEMSLIRHPHLRPNMNILDVGCRPGSITVDLAKKVPLGHVLGLEYVPDPLDRARALAASEGIANVSF